MNPGRPGRAVLALVTVLLFTAGCASIPEHSDPKAVKPVIEGSSGTDVPELPDDLDPFTLVRNFVEATAAPDNDYAAARLHLSEAAGKNWKVPSELHIVDNVDTLPVTSGPPVPPGTRLVLLQVDKVGKLRPDHSFVPEQGQYEVRVRVERGPDGQWRITDPPDELLVSRSAFVDNYLQVPIYFLDNEKAGVVPDLRYVVAQPASALPGRVINLLMAGPSEPFRGAMHTALPAGVDTKTNVSEAKDGALVVNFTELGRPSKETRRLIAAQVVLSVQTVSNARVRLLQNGVPLLPEQQELRPGDVASYEANNAARPDLPGLAVVNHRLRVLGAQAPAVPGPAGSGAYRMLSAARSPEGRRLAAVVRKPAGGVALRIGRYGEELGEVQLPAGSMTRPTWMGSAEVWTVVNGREIVRVLDNGDGTWTTIPIDTGELSRGAPISALRLSRDGTRVAALVGGRIVVAGVVSDGGQTTLRRPHVLHGTPGGAEVTGIDWLSPESLVAITDSGTLPVVEVTVNGFGWIPYTSANLMQPLSAVAAAPGRKVVVADGSGLWEADGPGDLWQLLPVPLGSGARPFFAG